MVDSEPNDIDLAVEGKGIKPPEIFFTRDFEIFSLICFSFQALLFQAP